MGVFKPSSVAGASAIPREFARTTLGDLIDGTIRLMPEGRRARVECVLGLSTTTFRLAQMSSALVDTRRAVNPDD
jgi:hypothetical protein